MRIIMESKGINDGEGPARFRTFWIRFGAAGQCYESPLGVGEEPGVQYTVSPRASRQMTRRIISRMQRALGKTKEMQ
jgi:hypothetical protein